MRPAYKQKSPTISNVKSLDLNGPSGENRTHGLLNPIQARYQNCATPGYLFAFAAHSLISIPDFVRFVKRFFQISGVVFTFYCPGFCTPKGCAKERYFQKSRYTSSSSSSWIGVVSSGGTPNSTVAKALLVKRYPELPDDDDELVGIIFPVNNEV